MSIKCKPYYMYVEPTRTLRRMNTDTIKFNSPLWTKTTLYTLLCADNVCVIVVTCEGAGSTTLLPLLPTSTVSWRAKHIQYTYYDYVV